MALYGHKKTPQVVSEAAAGTAEWVVIGPRGCSKGHGADCGKTLYRRLRASVMHRRRVTAPS